MKTTIKLSAVKSVVVQPIGPGVSFGIQIFSAIVGQFCVSRSVADAISRGIRAACICGDSASVHLDSGDILRIDPDDFGPGVQLSAKNVGRLYLTADQCGAMMVGIEMACEKAAASV